MAVHQLGLTRHLVLPPRCYHITNLLSGIPTVHLWIVTSTTSLTYSLVSPVYLYQRSTKVISGFGMQKTKDRSFDMQKTKDRSFDMHHAKDTPNSTHLYWMCQMLYRLSPRSYLTVYIFMPRPPQNPHSWNSDTWCLFTACDKKAESAHVISILKI